MEEALSAAEFEDAVGEALDSIPAPLLAHLTNVVFLIEQEPPGETPALLGVYDGIPLTERDHGGSADLPDRITIFAGPLTRLCADRAELIEEISVTVVHEVAHAFGIEEERLHALGWG